MNTTWFWRLPRRRWWARAALCLFLLVSGLAVLPTTPAVAQPSPFQKVFAFELTEASGQGVTWINRSQNPVTLTVDIYNPNGTLNRTRTVSLTGYESKTIYPGQAAGSGGWDLPVTSHGSPATDTAYGFVATASEFFGAMVYPDEMLSGFGTGKTAIWAQNTVTGAWWGQYNPPANACNTSALEYFFVVNPGTTTANVNVNLYRSDGTAIGSNPRSFTLGAKQTRTVFLEADLASAPGSNCDNMGYPGANQNISVNLTSDQPVNVSVYTSLGTDWDSGNNRWKAHGGSAGVYVAYEEECYQSEYTWADNKNGGQTTAARVTNPNTHAITVQQRFYPDDGSPAYYEKRTTVPARGTKELAAPDNYDSGWKNEAISGYFRHYFTLTSVDDPGNPDDAVGGFHAHVTYDQQIDWPAPWRTDWWWGSWQSGATNELFLINPYEDHSLTIYVEYASSPYGSLKPGQAGGTPVVLPAGEAVEFQLPSDFLAPMTAPSIPSSLTDATLHYYSDEPFPSVLELTYPGPYGDLLCWDCGTGAGDDYGDAPDTEPGTGPGNYQTLETDNGPHHTTSAALYLGSTVDPEGDGQPTTGADGDDLNPATGVDDEDGVDVSDLSLVQGSTALVDVTVYNNSGSPATLVGWIDFDGDGAFETSERVVVTVPSDPNPQVVTLNFGTVPSTEAEATYARFRLGDDATKTELPYGWGGTGEVEDYPVEILRLGTIGDYVWLDEDGDGDQDAGEAGIPNVRVDLYQDTDGDGTYETFIGTTYTDAHGGYVFTGLEPGEYEVRVDPDHATNPTLAEGLYVNPTYDEDGIGTPHTSRVSLSSGEEHMTADFGYNWSSPCETNTPGELECEDPRGAIGDRIWLDVDQDGAQDPEELGIEGVLVELYYDEDGDGLYDEPYDTDPVTPGVQYTATTDANGNYIFDDLPAGAYVVKVADSNFDEPTDPLYQYTQSGDPDHFGTTGTNNDNVTTAPVVLGPGDVFVNADFGYWPPEDLYSLGNTIFFDANGDGGYDPGEGEYGIPNVTVALIQDTNGDDIWDADGADNTPGTADDEPILATDTTDAAGQYGFDGLPAGDYIVWVNDTAHVLGEVEQSAAPDPGLAIDGGVPCGGSCDSFFDLTLSTDEVEVDFGYSAPEHDEGEGLIGDTIFLDRDRDGLPDPGEGIEGVMVRLYDTTGDLLAVTYTDENGYYSFGGLAVDADGEDYIVQVNTSTLPSGLTPWADPDDPDPALGSGDEDNQSTVTLTTAAPINLDQDFGYVPDAQALGIIGDKVWYDADGDGVGPYGHGAAPGDDNPENGIPGVLVNLKDGTGTVIAQAYTDANGDYLFTGLPAGTYTVEIDSSNFAAGGPLAGLSQTYDADGTGSANQSTVTLSAGEVRLDQDFGYRDVDDNDNSIGDFIWGDVDGEGDQDVGEPGLAGVTVRLYNDGPDGVAGTADDVLVATQVTDAAGYYLFDGLPDDTYTVVVDTGTLPPGWTTPATGDPEGDADSQSTVAVAGGTHDRVRDFGYPPDDVDELYSVGDTVWFDVDSSGGATQNPGEPGIPNVTVWLRDGTGAIIATTTTDANGYYLFEGLAAGNYTVEVDTSTLPAYVNPSPTYDPEGPVDSKAAVTLGPSNPHPRDIDFSYPPQEEGTGRIGNLIWEDVNADGVYQADGADGIPGTADDEKPIGGVTVDLYEDRNGNGILDSGDRLVGSTVTSGALSAEYGPDGNYLFENLPPGDYLVDVTDTDGVLAGYWHSDGAPGVDNNSQPDPYAVTIGGGEPLDDYTADFGYYVKPGAVGNLVWYDTNNNGLYDPGEVGIDGILVTLQIDYPDGTTVYLRTVTGDNPATVEEERGWYSFDNLLLDEDHNGDYSGSDASEPSFTITVEPPYGRTSTYDETPDAAGVGNGTDDNADDDGGEGAFPYQGGTDNTNDFGYYSSPTGFVLEDSFAAVPVGQAIQVTWQTELETGLLGFNLYRAEAEDGVPTRLNGALIRAEKQGSPLGASYGYTDRSVAEGVEYFYWLELIDLKGARSEYGPASAIAGPPAGYRLYLPLVIR